MPRNPYRLLVKCFPQTPEKSERKFKNLLSEQRHSGLKYFKKESFNGHKKYYYYIIVDVNCQSEVRIFKVKNEN